MLRRLFVGTSLILLGYHALLEFNTGYSMFGRGNPAKVGPAVIDECHSPPDKCFQCHYGKRTERAWAKSVVWKGGGRG